jgi:transcriptional regulator with XRE-family HTH domain/Zn-dependent peptidase ImmA (M78 family)
VIKNERQYKISRTQADRFAETLRRFEEDGAENKDMHPLLVKAKRDALRSQLTELEVDLSEYEELKAGIFEFGQLKSISDLPHLLIRARIASGLSQRDLADRLGLKEQQIQRYEATDYSSASLARIGDVVKALGVDVEDAILTTGERISARSFLSRVAETGLSAEFIKKRLFPRRRQPFTPTVEDEREGVFLHEAAEIIGGMFRWSPQQLLRGDVLELNPELSGVRFKVAGNANPERVTAYTVYAHYLALLVAQAYRHSQIKSVPSDPDLLREYVESTYGSVSLSSIVNYVWDLGIPVLPLDDPGAFHGACFREGGRNVIVLKQNTSSEARWTFDLLHEIWHAGQEPDLAERAILEPGEGITNRDSSEEETTASRFAAAVLLKGRGPELAEMSLVTAGKNLRRLKAAVQKVASDEGVLIDSLANYLAFRLAVEQGQNWWGTANSLQAIGNPWKVVRNVFFERADLSQLSKHDRELLAQALTPWKEISYA